MSLISFLPSTDTPVHYPCLNHVELIIVSSSRLFLYKEWSLFPPPHDSVTVFVVMGGGGGHERVSILFTDAAYVWVCKYGSNLVHWRQPQKCTFAPRIPRDNEGKAGLRIRIRTVKESWIRIIITVKSWIRIRTRVKRWIRICIKVKIQELKMEPWRVAGSGSVLRIKVGSGSVIKRRRLATLGKLRYIYCTVFDRVKT